jgi:TetR/AcrR family acrAB operon transcriptional repressor
MPDNDARRQQILNAAAAVIIRQGYDKTTMSDIADEAGVSRGTAYLYFKGKEELFEALLYREWMAYSQTWLESIEADPRGGTLGGFYRALIHAVNSRPLMVSIMRRDERVMGNYLRKPNNLASRMAAGLNTTDFIRALQVAGAVREDIDAAVTAHVFEIISYGQLTIAEFKPHDQFPPYEAVMQLLAEMLDLTLLPEGGGDSEAGKAVFWQIAAAARAQMEPFGQTQNRNDNLERTHSP